jgi:aminopeptidase N
MMKMKNIVVLILCLYAPPLFSQHVAHYAMDVSVDMRSRSMGIDALVTLDSAATDSITFLLWKNTRINSVEAGGKPLSYFFDTASASPMMYIANGRKLVIAGAAGSTQIALNYTSDMSAVNGKWEGVCTGDRLELAMYSGWYPFNADSYGYTADVKIRIDSGFNISGSGVVVKHDGYWELTKPWKSFDLVLLASRDMKSKVFEERGTRIRVDYETLGESAADSLLAEVKYAFELFEHTFGKRDSLNLKFAVPAMRDGGGYSRKYFVLMPSNDFDFYLRSGIAHEVSHFWWINAPTTSWEDWLNEAFAQYSTLRYIRERLDTAEFQKEVDSYRDSTAKLAPVWGIARWHNDAYNIIYLKGSLILCDLEKKMGTGKFDALLRNVSEKRIASTEDLLKLVATTDSGETSRWLENELKTR